MDELGRGGRGSQEGLRGIETGGVDEAEVQPSQVPVGLAAVAGDARGRGGEGEAAAGEPIEEGGLADVGTAENAEAEEGGGGGESGVAVLA